MPFVSVLEASKETISILVTEYLSPGAAHWHQEPYCD